MKRKDSATFEIDPHDDLGLIEGTLMYRLYCNNFFREFIEGQVGAIMNMSQIARAMWDVQLDRVSGGGGFEIVVRAEADDVEAKIKSTLIPALIANLKKHAGEPLDTKEKIETPINKIEKRSSTTFEIDPHKNLKIPVGSENLRGYYNREFFSLLRYEVKTMMEKLGCAENLWQLSPPTMEQEKILIVVPSRFAEKVERAINEDLIPLLALAVAQPYQHELR